MQSIRQHLEPVSKYYNRYLDGAFLTDLLQFKGGWSVGNDYVSRVFYSGSNQIMMKYDSALESTRNPTLYGLLADNWPRLLLLNAFERLVVAYQAYPSLKQRFGFPGTYSHTFTEIMNEGIFKGALKGITPSFLQFAGVMFPAVYLTAKANPEGRLWKFILNYTIMDTILYPLDTIKNILYADTLGTLRLTTLLSKVSFGEFYAGFFPKMLYNLPVLSGIYCTSQVGWETQALACWAVAALLYPINTYKVYSQVSVSDLSTVSRQNDKAFTLRQGYRGVLTYIAINALVGWSLRPLFSKEKLEHLREETQKEVDEYVGRKK